MIFFRHTKHREEKNVSLDIAEIIGFNVDLSSGDRTLVWEYLAEKWGITL